MSKSDRALIGWLMLAVVLAAAIYFVAEPTYGDRIRRDLEQFIQEYMVGVAAPASTATEGSTT